MKSMNTLVFSLPWTVIGRTVIGRTVIGWTVIGWTVIGLALLALSLGCSQNPSNVNADASGSKLSGRLTLTGSSTVAPLAMEIAKRFEQLHSGVRVDVQTGGSGKGISDAHAGIADIGMASRSLKPDEADLRSNQIAADGVGLIVHSSNTVSELTRQQVIAIYTNQLNNWKEVGGLDQEITVVHKAEGRATLEVFLEHFGIDNPTVKADVIVGDNQHCVKTVAGAKGAIGYVSIGTAEADIDARVPIRLLPLDGIQASSANVASGDFPMSRPLNLVTTESPSQLAVAFVQFCQSADVHDLVKSQYFVPVTSESNVAK